MAGSVMKRLSETYVKRAGLVGALYCLVPSAIWFAGTFLLIPFREVYLLRLGLALVVGSAIGAFINRWTVSMWLAKHRSEGGPATILDGLLVGAGTGFGVTLLPPLTALIGTNHPEMAKSFVIVAWLSAVLIGALIGAALSAVGRKHISREPEARGEADA